MNKTIDNITLLRGDRQLSDEEFKQAQNELNRIIDAKAKKK